MTKYTFFLKNPTIYKFKRHKDSSLVEDSMRIWWHRTWKIKKVIWLAIFYRLLYGEGQVRAPHHTYVNQISLVLDVSQLFKEPLSSNAYRWILAYWSLLEKTVKGSFTRGYSSNIGMVSSTCYKKDRFWLTRIENLQQQQKIF